MGKAVFYAPAMGGSLGSAVAFMTQQGCVFSPEPDETVTHLLLGVPAVVPVSLLEKLPADITVIGGKLPQLPDSYRRLDLLADPDFVTENADITARCAIALASQKLPVTWKGLPVLVVGWGRIGKCLARLLKAQDAQVTVAARRPEALALAKTLGYGVTALPTAFSRYRAVFNTADGCGITGIPPECLKLDLASVRGLKDTDVLWARGLPGKLAPESTGRLIAETVLRFVIQ